MKHRILFNGLFLSWCLYSFAQTSPFVKIYAYSQATLSSIKPQITTGENGNQISQASRENANYYFYAEYLPKVKFTATTLWIKGKPYRVKADSIQQTPIEILAGNGNMGNDSKKTTLVPAIANKVVMLSPGSQLSTKPTIRLRKRMAKADLVITYRWKGKLWYYSVSKIKVLEAIAGV